MYQQTCVRCGAVWNSPLKELTCENCGATGNSAISFKWIEETKKMEVPKKVENVLEPKGKVNMDIKKGDDET